MISGTIRPEQRKHEGECDDADDEGDAHDGAGEGEGVEDVPEAAELCQHHQLEAVHLDVAGLDLWERTWSWSSSSELCSVKMFYCSFTQDDLFNRIVDINGEVTKLSI